MRGYTDYPILALGDYPGVEAPIREVEIAAYDRNKYCRVLIHGHDEIGRQEIKAGYIYRVAGRCSEATTWKPAELEAALPDFSEP